MNPNYLIKTETDTRSIQTDIPISKRNCKVMSNRGLTGVTLKV